jgi:hypothetical protein
LKATDAVQSQKNESKGRTGTENRQRAVHHPETIDGRGDKAKQAKQASKNRTVERWKAQVPGQNEWTP